MPLEKMKQIFGKSAKLQYWLDIWSALAKAEVSLGIIPKEAGEEISAKAKAELIDQEFIEQDFEHSRHLLVSTIRAFQRSCKGDAGEYIHWGATTQDIMDTADALKMKQAHRVIFDSLREIECNLLETALKEADTIMPGRTHSQHALPVTFGYKVAVWVSEIRRHIERLKESRKRLFVGQLNGAVGTFASFGDRGPDVQKQVMEEVGLGVPDICWQASRDRAAEFACLLGMIAGSLGKIANEIYTLQSSEISEVEEPIPESKVGSSTMPHKRNPYSCECSMALVKRIKYYATLNIEAMIVEHERGGAGWYIQRDTLEELCLLTGDLLSMMQDVTKALVIHPDQMKKNLGILKGLILSEGIMLELGHSLGRLTAHEVVTEASKKTYREDISFKEALMQDQRVTDHLTKKQIEALLDPRKYTGFSSKIAKDVVTLARKKRERDEEDI